ncbi:hypothetical protein D3C72_2296640 [compost metagenome]
MGAQDLAVLVQHAVDGVAPGGLDELGVVLVQFLLRLFTARQLAGLPGQHAADFIGGRYAVTAAGAHDVAPVA